MQLTTEELLKEVVTYYESVMQTWPFFKHYVVIMIAIISRTINFVETESVTDVWSGQYIITLYTLSKESLKKEQMYPRKFLQKFLSIKLSSFLKKIVKIVNMF